MSDPQVIIHIPTERLRLHPDAQHIPQMSSAEWTDFLSDVSRAGIQEPLVVNLDDEILDGRHRHRAADICGLETVPVRVVNLSKQDESLFVVRAAALRRNLTESQRSMLAARVKAKYEKDAKKRQRDHAGTAPGKPKETLVPHGPQVNSRARDAAGQAVGVSGTSVDRASKVLECGTPELIAAVERGVVSVRAAEQLSTAPKDIQVAAIEGGAASVREAVRRITGKPMKNNTKRTRKKIPRVRGDLLESLAEIAAKLAELSNKPSLQVSYADVRKQVALLVDVVSQIKEAQDVSAHGNKTRSAN